MAGAAAMAVLLSTSVLLVLYLLLVDPAASPIASIPHRRSGRHVAFGPFATELELLLHGDVGGGAVPDIRTFRDTLDRLPDWSHFDAELGPLERYFGSDGKLNVKERLLYLFPMLDRAPKDGGVSCGELEAWLRRQAADRLDAVARRELKKHDKDADGVVKLREYLAVDHDQHIEHSADDDTSCAEAEKKFRQLDSNNDGYLTAEEARPVIQSLISGEFSYAKSHAKLLMKADDNKDNKLSLEEMLNHYLSFYNIVYMDDHYDYDDIGNNFHDELR
uniref:EF-hand domain-containing protein n=1 Tax=Oryza meridionalis TaxID=40149 RepID=A0A0E0DKC1_9ORYZ